MFGFHLPASGSNGVQATGPKPTGRAHPTLRHVATGMCAIASVMLACWATAIVGGHAYGDHARRELERAMRGVAGRREGSENAARVEANRTGVVGRISIPRLRLSQIILEGSDPMVLLCGVGHLIGSAFPGEIGNVVLAGHRDSFFRGLKDVRPGDVIRLTTLDGSFDYLVNSTSIVPPDRTDEIARSTTSVLTLVTCYPFQYVGSAPLRFIVRAEQLVPRGSTPS